MGRSGDEEFGEAPRVILTGERGDKGDKGRSSRADCSSWPSAEAPERGLGRMIRHTIRTSSWLENIKKIATPIDAIMMSGTSREKFEVAIKLRTKAT